MLFGDLAKRIFPRRPPPTPLPEVYYMAAYDLDEFDQVHPEPGWYVRWRELMSAVIVFGPWDKNTEATRFLKELHKYYRGIV